MNYWKRDWYKIGQKRERKSFVLSYQDTRHREKARNVKPTDDNPRPTDWKIEDLRKENYSGDIQIPHTLEDNY